MTIPDYTRWFESKKEWTSQPAPFLITLNLNYMKNFENKNTISFLIYKIIFKFANGPNNSISFWLRALAASTSKTK